MSEDYYARLHVHPRARSEVIVAAFRALVRVNHPDNPDGTEQPEATMAELQQARDVLLDADRREAYDAERSTSLNGNVVGSYRLKKVIAEGGFGTTYLAEHVTLGTKVCLKQCNRLCPEADAILEQEAKVMWDLRHYSIPTMRDLVPLEDGSFGLVMSYIEGPTLEQLVEKHGRLDPEHAAWIMERLSNALYYLHDHNVLHGDVKPQNVIVQPDVHAAVLVDYGLSLVAPMATGDCKGYTEEFASPEQIARAVIGPASDIYSLGLTMIYTMNGSLARLERREIPAEVPEPFAKLLKSCIARKAEARPTAEAIFRTIKDVREQSFGRRTSGMKPLTY